MINNAKKILDYWLTVEFLSQNEFPFKNIIPLNNKSRAYEYYDFAKNEVQKKIAEKEFKKKNVKPTWGDFTFYIGKVKREECLERIVEFLPDCKKDYENRVERSANDIAALSLQLTSNGEYKKNTLRVSPILWAINKLETNENFLSNAKKTYDADIKKLEEKHFVNKSTKDLEQEKKDETECNVPKLSECAVTLKKLQELCSEVIKCHIPEDKDSDKDKLCYDVVMRVNFYESDAAKALANDNYTGLGLDFFSDDIKLVLDNVEKLENDVYLGNDILKYITAYIDLENKKSLEKSRIDVVMPSKTDAKDEFSENNFYKQISKLLHIKNSPLGKWPSKFSPAFMQQIAINLAIQKYNSSNGKIFSVNGPPGTGKTTLLKEIIVNNIVEKAKLLADYEKADDAFVARPFKEDNGKYPTFIKQWYSIKNDKINDYGILVASCNNAAVENISKELPKSFVNDLRREKEDAELCAIADLFDVDKTESVYSDTTCKRECQKDIYFTDYTKQLFKKAEEKPKENNNANKEVSEPVAEKEPDVWGLISVALGKKGNIKNFCEAVLEPLSYVSNEYIQKRKEPYQKTRTQFTEQWQKVIAMQNELASVCDIEKQIFATDEQCEKYKIEIKSLEAKYLNCRTSLQQLQNEIEEDKNKLEIDRKELEKIYFEIKNLKKRIRFFHKIFKTKKYLEKKIKIDKLEKNSTEIQSAIVTLENKISKNLSSEPYAKYQLEQAGNEKSIMQKNINNANELLRTLKTQKCEIVQSIEEKKSLNESKEKYDSVKILDKNFIQELLSSDQEKSTKRHIENPWISEKYNREREKLFAFAMQLHKEFILSSKCCIDNLTLLSYYWGGKEDERRIVFNSVDKEAMVSSLFQTLFLLVPVVSTTFASVSRFLKDIKTTGAIGTLIVDEAGQAEPQMALGALYRSRKAIIVGDPKQVEPVVTDDLDFLKNAYRDELLYPYKDKTLSVQTFADKLNKYGTYYRDESSGAEWVGCPLLVHRRCISPMYDISNVISYSGMMKKRAGLPDTDKQEKFIDKQSQWINVCGTEVGNKNHFVQAQAKTICEILEISFEKNKDHSIYPSIYIISPFTTVVKGVEDYIKKQGNEKITNYMTNGENKRIGTVHTFQGKEADEVIFVLGCDNNSENAIKWVNKNIVNVAVTRAKYRLYIIGDKTAWQKNKFLKRAMEIIDDASSKKT